MSMIFDVDNIAIQTEWYINEVLEGDTELLKEKIESGEMFDVMNEYFADNLEDEKFYEKWELGSYSDVRGTHYAAETFDELTTEQARELAFEIIIDENGNVIVG